MSHRSVLPDNIKGTHSKKSLGQETLLIFTSLCLQSYPADASATPLTTLSPPARYWHCSSAHVLRVCLVPRGDHCSFHLSSFSLVSVTLVVCFIAALCVTLCWHAAGILWGSAQRTKDTVPGYGKVTQAWCKDRCEFDVCVRCARAKARASRRPHAHTHAPDSECMFSYVRTRGPLKKTDIRCHTRTARQQVGGNLCLFVRLCYHLLFPVKTGKERGENGGLESAALMCVGWRSSSVWQWPSRPGKTDLFWA